MAFQQVTRAEARNILALMYRNEARVINGIYVEFNGDGNFVVWTNDEHGTGKSVTRSLNQCLNYLFGEQND